MINESKKNLRSSETLTEDELYNMYFMENLRQSMDDIKNGRVMTLKELKEYIDGLEDRYVNNNIWQDKN